MPHQEKDHHIWAAEKKKKKEAYAKANAARKVTEGTKSNIGDNSSKNTAQKPPFTISDNLKAALCTEGQISPDQFDRICENCEDF